MADDIEEWNDLPEVLKRLSSTTSSSSDEAWKKNFCQICYVIAKWESRILSLENNQEENEFFSQLLGLTANLIALVGDTFDRFEAVVKQTCKVILLFCLKHLKDESSVLLLTRVQILQIIEGLLKFRACFSKEELITLQCKELTVPAKLIDHKVGLPFAKSLDDLYEAIIPRKTTMSHLLQDSLIDQQSLQQFIITFLRDANNLETLLIGIQSFEQLREAAYHYDQVFATEYTSVKVSTESISKLSEELNLIRELINSAIMEPLMMNSARILIPLIEKCLKAALFVASGYYAVDKSEVVLPSGTNMTSEDFCRKFGWKATEHSLAIFDKLSSLFSVSSRVDNHILQNLHAKTVVTILYSLKYMVDVNSEHKEKISSSGWKWFEGLNIMLVTMTSRVILLLSNLADELKIEVTSDLSITEKKQPFNVFEKNGALERLNFIICSLPVPELLLDLFFAVHEKGISLSKLASQMDEKEKINEDSKNKKADSSSEEEGSAEEGSMLGNFFVQSISDPDKTVDEPSTERQKEDAFVQSGEIFILLAGSLLDFTVKFLPICNTSGFNRTVASAFSIPRVAKLANLLKESTHEKDEIIGYVTKLLCKVITDEVIDNMDMEKLLAELHLNPSQGVLWPLNTSRYVLAVFARVALLELNKKEKDEIPLYATLALKSFFTSLVNAVSENNKNYVNVENMQVLCLLFQLLPSEDKKEIFMDCIQSLMLLAENIIVSPLHCSYLMLLFDFFLVNYSEPPANILSMQVQQNVLNFESSEDRYVPAYIPSQFEEHLYLNNNLIENKKSSKGDINAVFYDIHASTANKLDPKVIDVLLHSAELDYTLFFYAFMKLLANVLAEISDRSCDELIHVLGTRNTFLRMWAMMRHIPVPSTSLTVMKDLAELSVDHETYLQYLKWMPLLFELSQEEIASDINIAYSSEERKNEELKEISNSILSFSDDPNDVILFGQKLIPLITNLFNCENTLHFSPYMVADGLLMFLWLLMKKYVMERKDKLNSGEGLKNLLLGIIYLLKVEVEKSKELIIKQALYGEGDLSEDQFDFYMDIVGIDLPEPSTVINVSIDDPETTDDHLKVLPAGFQEAMKKWNQLEAQTNTVLIPVLLKGLELNDGKKNGHISAVISSCISHIVSSHMNISCHEPPFITYSASLKRCIRTLADACEELLPWLQVNFPAEFESLRAVGMSTFSSFWVDHVASHISNHAEMLTLLCLDHPGQDKLDIIVFIRMLEVIDKWMVKEISEGDMVQEKVLIKWLHFMGRLIDHTKTVVIFLQYFKQHEDSLYTIFQSVANDRFSEDYRVAYINLFTKLFNLGEQNAEQNVKLGLLKLFSQSNTVLTSWNTNLILSQKAPLEGCNLVRIFVNYGIQNKCSMERNLISFTNLCFNVINKIASEDDISIVSKFSFSTFFDVVIITATACGELGHTNLLQHVVELVTLHKETWSKHLSTEINFSNHVRECCNALILYITKLVSALSDDTENTNFQDVVSQRDAFEMTAYSDAMSAIQEDEDTNDEEFDDAGKVCTFTVTQRDYMNQHWYHCHTCKMSDGVGCCTVCANVCHKGHDVTYSKHGSFFCDCGAKEDGSCKAMTKRSSRSDLSSKSSKASPFTAWGELTMKSTKKVPVSSSKHEPLLEQSSSEDIFLLRQIVKDAKGVILEILQRYHISDTLFSLLYDANHAFSQDVKKVKEKYNNEQNELNEKMRLLYTQDKKCSVSDSLMSAVSGSQEGAFENIKLNFGGDQGQTLRQLMLAHVVHHKAMCLIASPRGRRQHLAVAHEKGKVTILQLSGLLRQPDVNQKKMTLNRLSSTIMPFTVLHMTSNPMNDDFLAVTGLKDCHVLILGHSGSTPNHLALSSKLDTGNFIIKPIWVPGSQTQLAILTADFVKIYDLSVSDKDPTHHFVLPSGKVRDATFVQTDSNIVISIISSQGYIYTEVLNEASSSGPFYMMNVVAVNHPDVSNTGQELLNGGGVSIFYSHLMKLMFFSYNKGRSFIGVLDESASAFTKVFAISTPITSTSPLIHWSEVSGQLGLIYCIQQNTGNVVVLAVKTDKLLVQEIKSPTKSAKVQSAVCCHHSSIEGKQKLASYRTTLIVLLDDGSLRIYNTNQEEAQFSQKHTVKSGIHSEIIQKKEKSGKQHGKASQRKSSTKFPVDFFEHCHVTAEVEFGGVDVLHVYNTNQIRTRLNTAGMYIANTKPSGFKLEVFHTSSTNVIVGMRVQVGVQSMERSPQYVEFLGRIVQMRMAKNRWFDIPFTREESFSISEKNKLVITFGPSSDPYGLSIVDSVKMYTKTKEAFGYTEEAADTTSTDISSPVVTVSHVEQKRPCFYSEILLTSLLSAVNKCFSVTYLHESTMAYSSALSSLAANLLTTEPQFYGQSSVVSYQTLELLHNLYPDDTKFYHKKDQLQISYMLDLFEKAKSDVGSKKQLVDIDVFALVLRIAQSVGNDRPENLVDFIEESYTLDQFAANLLETFWTLHGAFTAGSNSLVTKQDMTQLSHLVEMIVEVLFAIMLGNSEKINNITKLIIDLLLVKDQFVSFAAKQGLIKALQSRQIIEQTNEEMTVSSEEDKKDDSAQDQRNEEAKASVTETSPEEQTEQQHEAIIEDIVVGEEDDGIVVEENDTVNNDNLQMLLDDDSAMMEIALALSLQNQGADTGTDAVDQELEQLPLVEDEEEFEEEIEDELTTDQDDEQEIQADEADEVNGELSDVGQESFSESPRFIETPHLITNTDKPDVALTFLWGRLLEIFKDKIGGLMKLDGLQAIPMLQVLLALCSNLTDSKEDKQVLRSVIAACVHPLELEKQDSLKVAERNTEREVKLVLMRFLSVLMSRCSVSKQSSSTEDTKTNEVKSFDAHVGHLLSEFGLVDHCLFLLKSLHSYWQNMKTTEDEPVGNTDATLKVKPLFPTPDMMPFFMEQYVKSHALDLFEAFPQLVTEMILRVPYQIHKLMDADSEENYFSKDWTYILCEYMLTPHTPFVRRQVRKLLLALCGSKEKYRFVKDLHNLRSHLSNLRELLQLSGIGMDDVPSRNVILSYEETVSLTENISGCIDIASSRNENWQSFCKKEKAILPFLVQASYQVSSHVSAKIIELIILALTSHSTKKHDKSEKKEKSKTFAVELIKHVFTRCYGPILSLFMKHFLLESNSSHLRWKVHDLIHTIYLNITPDQQSHLIELMWSLWDVVPSYGHRAAQFIDLFGYFIIKTSYAPLHNKVEDFASGIMHMLKEGNMVLMKHPNASLYRKLQNYVELDGYYLESDPCIICNNPEVAFNSYKLSALKSDIRYTTKSQIIKLSANNTISKFTLKISDVKRAKMVKTINVFYNNKPVPSVVELKNKSGIWQKAKKINLTQGQTDVKVELTFPITAYNLMIEFAEFYDNIQFSSETLQCPRCSASVPAHPGVCSNCGENVYQCHKCRAINYDERDPFLCTSCGFCKYAKFEFTVNSHPCTSVEAINTEEDRGKALKSVNNSLEKADQYYQQLLTHRHALESLLRSAHEHNVTSGKKVVNTANTMVWNISSLAGTSNPQTTSSSAIAMASINHSIQGVAQRYCVDCKTAFEEMSKVTQTVIATRTELARYDTKQQETLSQALYASPEVLASPSDSSSGLPSFHRLSSFSGATDIIPVEDSAEDIEQGIYTGLSKCYGCTLSTVHHCLTLLRALSTLNFTHDHLLKQGLLQELVEHNLQHRTPEVVSLAQTLLIKLTSENKSANAQLNSIICDRITLCLSTQAANMVSEISLHSELSVLRESIACGDDLWEERFRCVFKLFLDSLQHTSLEVMEAVTLPCLGIINSCLKTKQQDNKKIIAMNKHIDSLPPVNALKWLQETSDNSFEMWKLSSSSDTKNQNPRSGYLIRKYGNKWLQKTGLKKKKGTTRSVFAMSGWLRLLLFMPSSRAMRQIVCTVLETLSESPEKKQMILHLLMSYLNELHTSGENAAEFISLVKKMLNTSEGKVYMCRFGILHTLCNLLTKEVDHLSSLENSTLNFDLAQGYALNAFAELLKSFLEDGEVKVLYRGRFVAEVLQCYLALRKLVVQRTKLVDESQEILLALLRQLTSGTEESAFMKTCVDALKKCPVNDVRTPVFIFEQLCNVIHKEEEETSEFFMSLEKDPQQEDYLQGRMQGNPYSSKEAGLGPLMRDLKNKICTECELVALLEDDTGMELLVNNKIINLDLPVDQVHRKIWCNGKNDSKESMKVIYRMRGLLGDATEDMVENLNSDKEEDIDEEDEYQRAAIMVEIGGLEHLLKRLSFIRDLSRAQQLVSVILKLFEYCVKVKVNRQYLNQPSVNAMNTMLATLNLALRLERDYGSTSGGAIIAERVLKIMEIVLHEATSEADIKQVVVLPGEESQLELLLNHITSPYVRSNPNVLQAMMRLTPFLTFGSESTMHMLIDHFMPFFDFESFDCENSPDAILHLDCFSMIADGISTSASGSKLKDLINAKGMVSKALQYLHSLAPPKSFRDSGILDSAKWKDFVAKPSLPYILRILTGLINGHPETQVILATDDNVGLLHHLEQVSSEEMVGSLAENLMEALRVFPEGKKKVAEIRRQTRNEKKMLAMAMRQKQLESLGMEVSNSGFIKAKLKTPTKEMEDLLGEKDQRIVCSICREGYKFYPNKVLGVYTYTSRCVLDQFENRPKRTHGYTTVSHFNIVHFDCHLEAVRHARSRDEWESAALQNGNTKCNGLLPLWGPKVSESSFATCLARHNHYLQESTSCREPTFHSAIHDIRLMLLRFAHQRSFSKETGGGGKHSNMYLLPYLIHIALYILNTTRQRLSEELLIKSFLDADVTTWITSCYEVNGPLFSCVLSLFIASLEEWKSTRITYLKRLMLLAHVRNLSSVPMNKLVNTDVKEYSVYKPTLMFFYLVDQLQMLCKGKLASDEEWPQAMSTFLRNNDDVIMKGADKILKTFVEDVTPCESFEEFCDVAGLLEELPDGAEFIKHILSPYSVDGNEVFC